MKELISWKKEKDVSRSEGERKTKKRGVHFIGDAFPILPFDVPPYGGVRFQSHARVKQRVRWKYY